MLFIGAAAGVVDPNKPPAVGAGVGASNKPPAAGAGVGAPEASIKKKQLNPSTT